MPSIYLSPSTQEWNLYVNGGTEEEYMNKIADAMIPYLRSCGISFTRNTKDMTAASSIKASNAGHYDVHLALHSNASPESIAGQRQGAEVYYYPNSYNGKRLATIIASNLKTIYYNPSNVRILPTTNLGEVTKTRAVANLIEFAYHDNEKDANWIKDNIDEIAKNVVLSLTEYFNIPFILPQPPKIGIVNTQSTALRIRAKPNANSTIIGKIPKGAKVIVTGKYQDWYLVDCCGVIGYVSDKYIKF